MTVGGHTPGSSLRCKECKQRRKKCDLQQPECLSCRRSGLRCSGPQVNATIFVNRHADEFSSQTQRKVLIAAFKSRSNESKVPKPVSLYQSTSKEIGQMKSKVERFHLRSTLIANTFILSARKSLLEPTYIALLDEFRPGRDIGIFSGDRVESVFPRHYSTYATCIRSLLPLATSSITAFDQCNLSLLALYYGRLHSDSGLVDLGRSSYTAALNVFSQDLLNQSEASQKQKTKSMFMSMALLLYAHVDEVDVYGRGHLAHIYGALEILRSCGTASVQRSPGTWQAFCGLRAIGLFVAIEERRHTFLAEPEWLTLEHHSITKTPRDRLTDIALEIPALLASADEIIKGLSTSRNGIGSKLLSPGLRLINEFAAVQRKFEEWLYGLKVYGKGPLFWSRKDPATLSFDGSHDIECTPKHSAPVYQLLFHSAPVAGFLVHLWTFQLALLMTSIDLQRLLYEAYCELSLDEADGTLASDILVNGLSTDRALAEEVANLILEAQPYLNSCLEGLLCLQFPVRIVRKYFEQTEDVT